MNPPRCGKSAALGGADSHRVYWSPVQMIQMISVEIPVSSCNF